jgi:hypothetical protein
MSTDRNPFADSNPSGTPVTRDEGTANPYASPREVSDPAAPPIGLWRDGKLLVVHRDAAFPPFCIRTNEPAQPGFRCNLTWSYPIDLWHRHLKLDVALCESCIQRYRRTRIVGWALICATMIILFMTIILTITGRNDVNLSILAVPPCLFLLVFGIHFAGRPGVVLKIKRAQVPYYWISGAHPDFVARFSNWTALR